MHTSTEGTETEITFPTGTSSDKNAAPLTPDNFNADPGNVLDGWAAQGWTIHLDRLPTLAPGASSSPKFDFWLGDGSQGDPYQITEEKHMFLLSYKTNEGVPYLHDKQYKLMNSVELTRDWIPIKNFEGVLDGNGYVISGLNMPESRGLTDAGLFGILKEGTTSVKNLGIKIKEGIVSTGKAGGVAAGSEAGATVTGCFVAGGAITGQFAGGIVGSNAGGIDRCYTTSGVVGGVNNAEAGGICGKNLGEIENCYSISTISSTVTNTDAGGIAGTNGSGGNIHDCAALNIEGITGSGTGTAARIAKDNSGTFADNDASFLIPGTWMVANTADGANGLGWNGETFPGGFGTEWDMTGDKLPRLNVDNGNSTPQPADDLLKTDYRTYAITLTQPAVGGTITATPDAGPALTDNVPYNIKANTVLNLTNTPTEGYQFKEYTIEGTPIAAGSTYTVAADGVLSAVFEQLKYTVTVTQPADGGTCTASYPPGTTLSNGDNANIPHGTVLTLTPVPANGYRLVEFTANDAEISNPYTVTGTVTLSAKFELIPPTPPTPPAPSPTVYHTVTLPAVVGATTDPIAGKYEVEAWGNFRFFLTLDKEYDKSEPVVTTSLGKTITPNGSDGAYTILNIRQPVEIFIDGIVKNSGAVGNETVEAEVIKVWTAKGHLHISTATDQTVQVYNLTGLLVKQANIPGGDTQWQLPSGIYIVQVGSERYKVIL